MSEEIEPVEVWYCDCLPAHWVVLGSDGEYYYVDDSWGAWGRRQRYEGQTTALRKAEPAVAELAKTVMLGNEGS